MRYVSRGGKGRLRVTNLLDVYMLPVIDWNAAAQENQVHMLLVFGRWR